MRVFRAAWQQQLLGGLPLCRVILEKYCPQDTLVIANGIGDKKGLSPADHPSPDKEDSNTHRGALPGQPEHILIQVVFCCDYLPLQGGGQTLDLIPVQGRLFKGKSSGGLLHFFSKPFNYLTAFAGENEEDLINHLKVSAMIHGAGTGSQAPLHLEVETGAFPLPHRLAAAQGKHGKEQVQGGAHGTGGGVGTEITITVFQPPAGDQQPGPLLPDRDLDQWIVFIVPEDDIIPGAVLFDERCLKNKSLFFRGGEDGLHPPDMGEHDRNLGVGCPGIMGILSQSFAQIPGLADVQDLFAGQHLIDPRTVADCF